MIFFAYGSSDQSTRDKSSLTHKAFYNLFTVRMHIVAPG
eukprot:COSAG02_NODE_2168_length_9608_cov_38.056893_11_plen_39_part_00